MLYVREYTFEQNSHARGPPSTQQLLSNQPAAGLKLAALPFAVSEPVPVCTPVPAQHKHAAKFLDTLEVWEVVTCTRCEHCAVHLGCTLYGNINCVLRCNLYNILYKMDEWKYCNTIVYKWPFLWNNWPTIFKMYKLYQVSQIQAIMMVRKLNFWKSWPIEEIGGILDYTTTNWSFDSIFLE